MANGLHKIKTSLRAVWRGMRLLRRHVAKGAWIVAFRLFRSCITGSSTRWCRPGLQRCWSAQAWSWRSKAQPRITFKGGCRGQALSSMPFDVARELLHASAPLPLYLKSDVKGWPIIGTLATAAGAAYQRSSRRDAMRMITAMADAFKRGEILAVFPEGTTGDGRSLLSFPPTCLRPPCNAMRQVRPGGCKALWMARRVKPATPPPMWAFDPARLHLARAQRRPFASRGALR